MNQRVQLIPNAAAAYEAACLLIVRKLEEVEPEHSYMLALDADNLRDRAIMLRLQLLASPLASERGWPPIWGNRNGDVDS